MNRPPNYVQCIRALEQRSRGFPPDGSGIKREVIAGGSVMRSLRSSLSPGGNSPRHKMGAPPDPRAGGIANQWSVGAPPPRHESIAFRGLGS